jgi:hypothetical protein
MSLKAALERLLGAPCYHMVEVFAHPEHVPLWRSAMVDEPVDWDVLFAGYVAAVDWPVCGVWRPIAAAYPDAPVLLSTRASADEWWESAKNTIFAAKEEGLAVSPEWDEMITAMFHRFTSDWPDEAACKAAYEAHNAAVRAEVPSSRLVEWLPADGWGPLCEALGVAVPDEPFPKTNTTAEFRAMVGLDPPA